MDIIPVPTLSTQGFVSDAKNKMGFLLSHYFASMNLQTTLYTGRVTSFPKIVQQCSGDSGRLVDTIKTTMETYMSRYYSQVKIEVKAPLDFDELVSNKFDLELNIEVVEPSGPQNFLKLVRVGEGKVQALFDIINNGS